MVIQLSVNSQCLIQAMYGIISDSDVWVKLELIWNFGLGIFPIYKVILKFSFIPNSACWMLGIYHWFITRLSSYEMFPLIINDCWRSLPYGPGDVPIVLDQNTIGWYKGQHCLVDRRAHGLQQLFTNASCVYVQVKWNSWVVRDINFVFLTVLTHFLFSRKGGGCIEITICAWGLALQSLRAA